MKIRVTPSQLARQLPELRLDIIQTYEDYLTIEGEDISVPLQASEERFSILKKFPHFIDIFTPKELDILSELAHGERAAAYLRNILGYNSSNSIDVHIKNIRQKFKTKKLPMKLVTVGMTGFRRLEILK